jgi:hypothetical protein
VGDLSLTDPLARASGLLLATGFTQTPHGGIAVATIESDSVRSQALYEECFEVARESGAGTGDRWTIGSGLEGLAAVVAAHGRSIWAAHLWGAVEPVREATGIPLPPVERASYVQAVAAARTQFGEHTLAAAWAEGRAMSPAQAVAAREEVALPAATPENRANGHSLPPPAARPVVY